MTNGADPFQPAAERAERIRLLVCEHAAVAPGKVALDSKLRSDLGITGDDAVELMSAFFNRFSVDPTGFHFIDHFDWEAQVAQGPLVIAAMRLFSNEFDTAWRESKKRESDLTVRHLADCAARGRWLRPQYSAPDRHPANVAAALNVAFRKSAALLSSLFFFAIGIVFPCAMAVVALAVAVDRGGIWPAVIFLGAAWFVWQQLRSARAWALEKTRTPPEASST